MARPTKHADWWPFHWKPRRWKRTSLPDEIRAMIALQPGEQVLSFGYSVDGAPVVATDRGLWSTTGVGDAARVGALVRLDWERIGTIKPHRRRIDLTLLSEDLGHAPGLRIDLSDPGEVVDAAWDQMADVTVTAVHVPVTATAGVRVVARRGRLTDEVVWGLLADPGLDVADPTVRTEAVLALDKVRRESQGL